MSLAQWDHLAAGLLDALWRCSWQAGILALLVLLAQALLRGRISSRWRYNLWAIVIIRLLVPITPSSPLSIFNLIDFHSPAPLAVVDSHESADIPLAPRIDRPDVSIDENNPVIHVVPNPKHSGPPWHILIASIWLLGMLVMLARIIFSSIRLARAVRGMPVVDDPGIASMLDDCRAALGIRRRVEMRISPHLAAPALMGVFHPRLLLPAHVLRTFSRQELRLILLHELGHQTRQDVAANWLLAVLQSVHWFNPLIWLAFARARADRELACDELVLTTAAQGQNTSYGHTLVKLLESLSKPEIGFRTGDLPAPVGTIGILERAHPNMRRRITMIAQFARRRSLLGTWIALACLAALAGVGLTDRVRAQPASGTVSPTTRPDQGKGSLVQVLEAPPGATLRTESVGPVQLIAPATQPISDAEKTYAQFHRRIPEIKFDAIGLSDAIDFLRDIAQLNIVVNARALEAAGIDMNMPISLRLNDVTLEQALRQILEQAGGGTVRLGFGVQGNGIVISTAESVPTRVRAYDVSDLLGSVADRAGEQPAATTRPGSATESRENLVQIIQQDVSPDSWRSNGGTVGSISTFGDRLIISTTDMNHLEIDHLMAELRSTQMRDGSMRVR